MSKRKVWWKLWRFLAVQREREAFLLIVKAMYRTLLEGVWLNVFIEDVMYLRSKV